MLKRAIFAFMLLAAATAALAQDVKYEKYTLPNGMTIILHEDHSLPIVAVNTWYRVGSKDEPERRSGFAHLFEHLMFMGTKRAPTGKFDEIMESGGGSNNADTTEDRTDFYDVGPSNLLPTLIWLEADRLEDLGRMMDQKKLDLQRSVVLNERRENIVNAPYGMAEDAIPGLMFPKGHPYHTSVMGSPEDLNAATVENVQDFFATYYVPNNASMVIAGDFDPKTLKPLIASLVGTIPRGNDVPRKPVEPVHFKGVQRVTMVDKVQYPKIVMVWHSPAIFQPGDAEMDLTAAALSNGISSRLYQKLIVEDELVSDVSAEQESKMLGSLFRVEATVKQGVPLDKVEKVIDDVLAQFRKNGPTAEELKREAAGLEFQTLASLQSLQGLAASMNEYEFYFGEPNSFKKVLERYQSATPDSVKSVASRVLDPDARLILRVMPQGTAPAQNPRDKIPEPASPEKPFQFQKPTELTLANGAKLFYWRRPELPLTAVSMLLNGGADNDPPAKAGLAEMMTSMLDEGAGTRDAEKFSNAMELLGAQFSAQAGHQASSVNLSVLTANLDKALDLYADAIIRPQFDPKEWTRIQDLEVESLTEKDDEPESVARKVALREFFGSKNSYGRATEGTPATVKGLTLDEVKGEYAAMVKPANATFFAAGNLEPEQMKQALDRVLGSWKEPPGPKRSLNPAEYPPPANQTLKVLLVNKPGAVQTVVRFVMPAPAYNDPNRITLEALGTVLGGTFTSRLNHNLREEKGYTYGAAAGFDMDPKVGYFTATAAVRSDVTGASLKEFLAEFARIRNGDVNETEAMTARGAMRTGTIQSAESLGSLLGTATNLYVAGRPFTDLGVDLQKISQLKASDLNAVAKQAIPLEKGVLVLVGDKDTILKQLQGLGLPQPVEVQAD